MPTPETDVPVPPPPQQAGGATAPQQGEAPTQEGSRGRSVILGCLAIFGLLVLIIVAAGALGGGGDEPVSSPPEQAERDEGVEGGGQEPEAKQPLEGEKAKPQRNQQANESQEDVYSIGEEVRVGDVSYKVTSAKQATQLKDPYRIDPPLRGNFIVVTFVFTNNGDDPATVSDLGLYLYDSQGREFETDTDAAYYLPQDKSLYLLDRVNPGLSKTVQTVYSVPPDARGFELEVTSGFFASETARIKLGF